MTNPFPITESWKFLWNGNSAVISSFLWYSGLKQISNNFNKTVKNQPSKPLCSALLESIKISALLHSCPTWTLVPPLRELPKPLVICPKHLFYQLESCPCTFWKLVQPYWTLVRTWTNPPLAWASLPSPGHLPHLTRTVVTHSNIWSCLSSLT